jgi:hypothetical protein
MADILSQDEVNLLLSAVAEGELAAEQRQEVLRTRQLELVDEAGRPRAVLILDAEGAPTLVLYDQTGTARAELALTADGRACLGFRDGNGVPQAALKITSKGTPSLIFYDKEGRPKGTIALDLNGDLVHNLAGEITAYRVDSPTIDDKVAPASEHQPGRNEAPQAASATRGRPLPELNEEGRVVWRVP